MQATRTFLLLLAVATAIALPESSRNKRQLADDDSLQPLDDGQGADQTREKRKLEGVTQAKFGIKNAILGLVFGKINSIIDAKTRLIDQLDKQNIEKNKAFGIEAPASGLSSLTGVIGQVIGPKLQLLGPKIQTVSSLIGGASGGGSGGGGSGGGGLGSIISLVTSLSGSSSGGGNNGPMTGGTVETIDSSEEDDS